MIHSLDYIIDDGPSQAMRVLRALFVLQSTTKWILSSFDVFRTACGLLTSV